MQKTTGHRIVDLPVSRFAELAKFSETVLKNRLNHTTDYTCILISVPASISCIYNIH